MNPWDEAKRVVTDRGKLDIKSPWMVNKILSFSPVTLMDAINLNEVMGKLRPEHINLIFECFPKRNKAPFFRNIRKEKEAEPKLVEKICKHYCVNKYHADQIIDLLREQGEHPESHFGLKEGE